MRRLLGAALGAAILTCASAAPASAAVIVQTGVDEGVGFEYFDASLGTLDSVSLAVTVTRLRDWALIVPGEDSSRAVSYDLAGTYDLQMLGLSTSGITLTTGPQSQTVPLTPDSELSPFYDVLTSSAVFSATFAGSASFSLDPSLFSSSLGFPDNRFYYNGFFLGFYDGGPDSANYYGPIQVAGGPSTLVLLSEGCGGYNSGFEDSCGSTNLTLTYNYTPFSAVPEPSTWAMMLLGFGAVGFSLRRLRPMRRGEQPQGRRIVE